jgi:hypothetical protein
VCLLSRHYLFRCGVHRCCKQWCSHRAITAVCSQHCFKNSRPVLLSSASRRVIECNSVVQVLILALFCNRRYVSLRTTKKLLTVYYAYLTMVSVNLNDFNFYFCEKQKRRRFKFFFFFFISIYKSFPPKPPAKP